MISRLLERAGITYRQLDYWATRGYLPLTDGNPGTGNRRHLSRDAERVAVLLAELIAAGFTPAAAAQIANAHIADGTERFEIGDGISLLLNTHSSTHCPQRSG